ncbi:MAG: FkbM family methyltransferase [Alphaproteobacteria bacterium]
MTERDHITGSGNATKVPLVEPGATVLEIGAGTGADTLSLAIMVGETGRVIAIEPNARDFIALSANIAGNPNLAPRITCYQILLTDYDATTMTVANDSPEVQTLDTLCARAGLGKIDMIKMEAGGTEPAILQGAETVLRRDRPVMILDLAPAALERAGSGLGSHIGHLRRLGCRLHDPADDRLVDNDLAGLAASIPPGGSVTVVARASALE